MRSEKVFAEVPALFVEHRDDPRPRVFVEMPAGWSPPCGRVSLRLGADGRPVNVRLEPAAGPELLSVGPALDASCLFWLDTGRPDVFEVVPATAEQAEKLDDIVGGVR